MLSPAPPAGDTRKCRTGHRWSRPVSSGPWRRAGLVLRVPRDPVPVRGAGRPVAGGCPASCGARRVSYHGACAWHSGREGTGDGRGQAGLVLCLAWGPSPKTRSPQPRVTGPGPGTCAVQALSAPARQGHALPRLSRQPARPSCSTAAIHVRTRLVPPVPGEPRWDARSLRPKRAPTFSAAPAGAPKGADLEPAWQGGSSAMPGALGGVGRTRTGVLHERGPRATSSATPLLALTPVPAASVAATQYEDPTTGGHWAARVKCCLSRCWARSSQPVTPLRTNPSACFSC